MRISLSAMSIAAVIGVFSYLGLATSSPNVQLNDRGSGRLVAEKTDRGSGRFTNQQANDRGSGRSTVAYRGSGRLTTEPAYRGSGRLAA